MARRPRGQAGGLGPREEARVSPACRGAALGGWLPGGLGGGSHLRKVTRPVRCRWGHDSGGGREHLAGGLGGVQLGAKWPQRRLSSTKPGTDEGALLAEDQGAAGGGRGWPLPECSLLGNGDGRQPC